MGAANNNRRERKTAARTDSGTDEADADVDAPTMMAMYAEEEVKTFGPPRKTIILVGRHLDSGDERKSREKT